MYAALSFRCECHVAKRLLNYSIDCAIHLLCFAEYVYVRMWTCMGVYTMWFFNFLLSIFFRYQRSILTSIYYGFIEKWKWSDILHSFHSIDVKLIGNDNSSKLNANFFRKILYISRSRIHVYYVQCTLDDNKGSPILTPPHTHTHAHNRLIHSVIHGAFVVCLMDFLQDCRQKNKEWTLIFKPFNGRIC